MATSKNILKDSDATWNKNPIAAICMGDEFKTLEDVMSEVLMDDSDLKDKATKKASLDKMLSLLPPSFSRRNYQTSAPGQNDAINPYWAFCEYDDVIIPLSSSGVPGEGCGRVYDDMYNRNQQILWMSFGVPQYSDPLDFFKTGADAQVSNLMNTGEPGVMAKLGGLIGKAGNIAFKLPLYPIIWLGQAVDAIAGVDMAITEYCSLKNTQLLYYKAVNSLLVPLAVSMGIVPNGAGYDAMDSKGNNGTQASAKEKYDATGLPRMMKNGPDILAIISASKRRSESPENQPLNTDDLYNTWAMDRHGTKERTSVQKFTDALAMAALEGMDYIGFRVEKGGDPSDTFSNSIGPSPIAATLNGMGKKTKDKKYIFGGLEEGSGVIGMLAGMVGGAADFATSFISKLTDSAGIVELGKGNGFFSLPEVWQDSKFSTTHSVSIHLGSRAGDPVSILQSVYLPICCLIAGASARGIGPNMYTSPFVFRAYLKGQFSIPYGIIESLTIKRGVGEFGWSRGMLPTAVDVDITLRNLNPALFLTIGDKGSALESLFSKNSGMTEYLTTLSGLGLYDRMSAKSQLAIKYNTAVRTAANNHSALMLGATVGNSRIARAVSAIFPWQCKVPRS